MCAVLVANLTLNATFRTTMGHGEVHIQTRAFSTVVHSKSEMRKVNLLLITIFSYISTYFHPQGTYVYWMTRQYKYV